MDSAVMTTQYTDISTRTFVVSLKAPCNGKSSAEAAKITGLSVRQVNRIYTYAIERGFNPNIRPLIFKDKYLRDALKSGRPRKAMEEAIKLIIGKVERNQYRREKTYADITGELSSVGREISTSTVYRILVSTGFRKIKLMRKPRLTKVIKANRLTWYITHQD
jgi:hypothetical protein